MHPMPSKSKIQEWVSRYGPPEIAGILTVLVVAHLTVSLTGNNLLAAFVAPLCEVIVFYSIIVIRDVRSHGETLSVWKYFYLLRNIIIEFGPAEYIDTFIIRPICLAFSPTIISPYLLAIFIGDMVANITFYIPVIISYELRKKFLKN